MAQESKAHAKDVRDLNCRMSEARPEARAGPADGSAITCDEDTAELNKVMKIIRDVQSSNCGYHRRANSERHEGMYALDQLLG